MSALLIVRYHIPPVKVDLDRTTERLIHAAVCVAGPRCFGCQFFYFPAQPLVLWPIIITVEAATEEGELSNCSQIAIS